MKAKASSQSKWFFPVMAATALWFLGVAPISARAQGVCAPCQSIANQIKSLEAEKQDASQDLKNTKNSSAAGEVGKLLKKIAQKKKQLQACMASKCPPNPELLPVEISLSSFTVNIPNEGQGDDDPYLFVVAIYVDGTTVKVADLAHSSVRLDSPVKTHNNLGMDAYSDAPKTGKAYSIPSSVGRFEKTILPLSGLSEEAGRNFSRVAILVITMDEDSTSDAAADAGRKALVDNLQKELNAAIKSMKQPDISALQQRISDKVVAAMKKETLKDWWTPWGLFDAVDPDDFIGADFAMFSYAQILNAGSKGLPIMLNCKSSDGSYTINGTIRKK